MTFPPMYVASKNVFGKPRTCRDLAEICRELAKPQKAYFRSLSSCGPGASRRDLLRGVGRRWSPPGGLQLNPPPHRRWRRVLDSKSTWLRQILANIYQAKLIIFKGPGLDVGLPSLYLSPGPRTFRRAEPNLSPGPLVGHFFRFFSLPKNPLKFASKK